MAIAVVTLLLVALASPAFARTNDVTTAVMKTPLPLNTNLVPALNRTGYLTITELGVNVTTNSSYFAWEVVGADVFKAGLSPPVSLGIYAFRANYPVANGAQILNLVPADGFSSSPLWSNFTYQQLNAGRAAAGLPPAPLDFDFEDGNGTLVLNGGDMIYVMNFADGTSTAGFGSWLSELPPQAPPSDDLFYVSDVNNVTSSAVLGTAAWISPKDYWNLLVSDNEDGTWQTALFSVVNTTGLTTTAVKLVALKNNVPVTIVDLTSKVNFAQALGGIGSDNPNAFTRKELNAGLKSAGLGTSDIYALITSTKDGVTYNNMAPFIAAWVVDPNVTGFPSPPPAPVKPPSKAPSPAPTKAPAKSPPKASGRRLK